MKNKTKQTQNESLDILFQNQLILHDEIKEIKKIKHSKIIRTQEQLQLQFPDGTFFNCVSNDPIRKLEKTMKILNQYQSKLSFYKKK